jgi:hypothetical protein
MVATLIQTGASMGELVRYRYNTVCDETPGGEWKWRVILERNGGFEEVLAKQLSVNVPSFSRGRNAGGWAKVSHGLLWRVSARRWDRHYRRRLMTFVS